MKRLAQYVTVIGDLGLEESDKAVKSLLAERAKSKGKFFYKTVIRIGQHNDDFIHNVHVVMMISNYYKKPRIVKRISNVKYSQNDPSTR